MIKLRTLTWACLASLPLLLPTAAHAVTLDEVEGKTDEELAEGQWEVRRVNANKSSNKCGFLSILISTFWRGYGHYCIDDASSHYKLLGMEGASVAMLASSLIMGSVSKDDGVLSGTWKSLFHYGITLFIAIAPSLGFLGTVIGMVMAFDQIQMEGDINPNIVAAGMKVALITTIFGIICEIISQ